MRGAEVRLSVSSLAAGPSPRLRKRYGMALLHLQAECKAALDGAVVGRGVDCIAVEAICNAGTCARAWAWGARTPGRAAATRAPTKATDHTSNHATLPSG